MSVPILGDDETVTKEADDLIWGKTRMEKLTCEEHLPAGGIQGHLGGKTSLSAASPEVPVTVSLVPQHSPLLLHGMQDIN